MAIIKDTESTDWCCFRQGENLYLVQVLDKSRGQICIITDESIQHRSNTIIVPTRHRTACLTIYSTLSHHLTYLTKPINYIIIRKNGINKQITMKSNNY